MKKAFILIIVLFGLICTPLTGATERFLQGRVLLVGDHDELTPLVGQDVLIQQSGDSARTKEGGRFRLFLPNHFQAGSKITLGVVKAEWRIQYPLEGEVIIPNALEKALIDIRMLPVGSKKFWSHDRMEKFIQDIAEKVKQQAAMGQGGEIFVLDMGAPIRIADLARKMIHLSGYSESEIRIEFIGLRPGEKLYEELLADAEHTRQTPHPKLRIAQGRAVDADFLPYLRPWFAEPCQSYAQVRENLMRWVPEYQPVSFS